MISSGPIPLYAERAGNGPALLYISGTGAALATRPNAFDLPIASAFDVISYDQRGLGASGKPDTATPGWTMADYADDAALVLDWAGLDQVALLGISFGGMVAQEFMVRHPQRVSHAVLACTSSGGAGGSSYPLHTLSELTAAERIAALPTLTDTRWADPTVGGPLREMFTAALSASATSGPDTGGQAQLTARSQHDTYDRLPSVTAPTLVASGRFDGIAPLSNSVAIAAQIPGARLMDFDGGHAFVFQDPAAFPAITAFLLDPTHAP